MEDSLLLRQQPPNLIFSQKGETKMESETSKLELSHVKELREVNAELIWELRESGREDEAKALLKAYYKNKRENKQQLHSEIGKEERKIQKFISTRLELCAMCTRSRFKGRLCEYHYNQHRKRSPLKENRCKHCGTPTKPHSYVCETHLKHRKPSSPALCVSCKKLPHIKGRNVCQTCLPNLAEIRKKGSVERHRKLYRLRKANGLCVNCASPVSTGAFRCNACLNIRKLRQAYKEAKAKSLA